MCVCVWERQVPSEISFSVWSVTGSQHRWKGRHLYNNSWPSTARFRHHWYRLTHSGDSCLISSQLRGQDSQKSELLMSRYLHEGVSRRANRTHNYWYCRETSEHKTFASVSCGVSELSYIKCKKVLQEWPFPGGSQLIMTHIYDSIHPFIHHLLQSIPTIIEWRLRGATWHRQHWVTN